MQEMSLQNLAPQDSSEFLLSEGEFFLDELEGKLARHRIFAHPLLLAFRRQQLSWPQLRVFAIHYYPHILKTRLHQAMALSVSPWEPVQHVFAAILMDEYGLEKGGDTHPELYRTFLIACGYCADEWSCAPVLDCLERYIRLQERLCTGDPLVALGAAGVAMEWPIPRIYGDIVQGLRPHLKEESMEIFIGHMEIDTEHAAQIREVSSPLLASPSAQVLFEKGVMDSLEGRCRWMDGLWARVCSP